MTRASLTRPAAKALTAVLILASLGALSLAACTASSTGSKSSRASLAPTAGGANVDGSIPEAGPSAPAAAPSHAAGGAAKGAGSLLADRSVIYTADITVRADDIKNAVDQVEALAGKADGVVYDEQVDLTPKATSNPGNASATVTLKVPPDNLDATLDAIGALGTELSRTKSSDDVTTKVVDVNARIDAARASIARLTDLLNHAGTVADLLNVENQLAQRDSDLESLEQQQKALKAQTSQATITAHLVASPPIVLAAKVSHTPGFLRGLTGGWHAFTNTVTALLTAFGAVLPFVAVITALAAGAFFGRRKLRGRRRPQES